MVGAVAAVLVYFAGLRLVEGFVQPSFDGVATDSGVRVVTLAVTLAVIAIIAATTKLVQHPAVAELEERMAVVATRTAHPGVGGTGPAPRWSPTNAVSRIDAGNGSIDALRSVEVARSKVRADVARASRIVAPAWPLTSFVAVNPLGGLEHLGFDEATAVARRQLRSRTHLSLEEFRRDHQDGLTTFDDVRWAVESELLEVCTMPPVDINGRRVPVAEIIRLDLLHGPDLDEQLEPQTALERVEGVTGPLGAMIDLTISHSAAQFTAHATGSFHDQWLHDATQIAGLRHHLSSDAHQWLAALGDDPAVVISAARSRRPALILPRRWSRCGVTSPASPGGPGTQNGGPTGRRQENSAGHRR